MAGGLASRQPSAQSGRRGNAGNRCNQHVDQQHGGDRSAEEPGDRAHLLPLRCAFVVDADDVDRARPAHALAGDDLDEAVAGRGHVEEPIPHRETGIDARSPIGPCALETETAGYHPDYGDREILYRDRTFSIHLSASEIARLDLVSGQSAVTFEAVDGDVLFAHLPDERMNYAYQLDSGRYAQFLRRMAEESS